VRDVSGQEALFGDRARTLTLVLALAVCSGEATAPSEHTGGGGSAPPSTPHVTGGCENLHVDAPCTFASLDPVDPLTGAPALAGSVPEAEQTFAVVYRLEAGAAISEAHLHVRARGTDAPALRAHYEANAAARCSGDVVRAPCPPGVFVVPAVPAPPAGQLVRVP
jgi:hypothetical protein